MLSKKSIDRISQLAGLNSAALKNAIESEAETELDIPADIVSFAPDELQAIRRREYENGKLAGVEISVKSAKERHGLQFTGRSIETLLEAASEKAIQEARRAPEQRIASLTKAIETLERYIAKTESQLSEKVREAEAEMIRAEIENAIPARGPKDPQFSNAEILHLLEINGYEFKMHNGRTTAFHKGEIVGYPIDPPSINSVIAGFMQEKGLIRLRSLESNESEQGNPGPITRMSDLKARYLAEGKSLNGADFMAAVETAVAHFPDFDFQN